MSNKDRVKIFLRTLAVALVISAISASLCAAKFFEPACVPCKFSQVRMGTIVEITIYGVEHSTAQLAAAHVFTEMTRLEKIFNPYDPMGELFAMNNSAYKQPFHASPDLCAVLKKSLDVCKLSSRAFDPTFFVLGIDFKDGISHIPDESALKRRLALVNCENVKIEPDSCEVRFKKNGMKVGLGGIAKGFIGDRASEILKERGIENFIVNAGGDMIISGSKGTDPWRVGIQDPQNPDGVFALIEPKDCTIATSGNYERFGEKGEKKWGHIINPRNGKSADESLSATICAHDLTTADAWATALFVLGEDGIAILEKLEGVEGLLMTKDKAIFKTKDFDQCSGFVGFR